MVKENNEHPKQERSIQTRELIIKTGLKLFATEGFHDTSTKKIAKAAGISIGNFYNYFKDKKELIIEIFRRNIEQAHSTVINAMFLLDINTKDKKELLRDILNLSLETHKIDPGFHREITKMKFSDPDIRAIQEAEEKKMQAHFLAFIIRYKDDLKVTDIESASQLIVMTIEEVTHSIILFNKPLNDSAKIINSLIEMIYSFLFKE